MKIVQLVLASSHGAWEKGRSQADAGAETASFIPKSGDQQGAPNVPISIQTIDSHFTRTEFQTQLREALASWENPPAGLVEKTMVYVNTLSGELISLCKEVDDEEQIEQTVAIFYIELKSRWIALNTRVNYQTFRTGACDVESAFRASGVSMLLADVESLINQDDIGKITDFLAQPIRRAA